jgi:hypothetical protein
MFNRTVFAGAALACWVAVLALDVARAQQPTPPPAERRENEQSPPPAQPAPVTSNPADSTNPAPAPQAHRVKSVLGTKVSIQGNLVIGTVDDVIFDDNGYVDYLIVLNEGKYVVVPWQAAKFNFEQRTASVNVSEQQFRQVPTYTTTQNWPNVLEPAYRTRIYGYYGLTPGQERRIERRDRR